MTREDLNLAALGHRAADTDSVELAQCPVGRARRLQVTIFAELGEARS
jgi:hypothetical protein